MTETSDQKPAHNPHGTTLNFMLRNLSDPFDGECLQCHTDVGINF